MGMLDSLLGGDVQNPFEQYRKMQANPFTKMIPGSEYLSGMPGQQGLQDLMGGMRQDNSSDIPTDFAGVPPGLPNLPENLQGFGFGQTAPQMNTNSNLRQNLIQQLLKQLMNGGMSGANAFGGGMSQPSPMGASMYGIGSMNQDGI